MYRDIALKFFLGSILLGLFQTNYSQNIFLDYNTAYEQAIKYSHNNPDSLIYYSKKMQLVDDRCLKVKGLLYEARGHYQTGNYEESKNLALKTLLLTDKAIELCDKKNLNDSYRRLFFISKNMDQYDEALHFLFKQKEIIDQLDTRGQYYLQNMLDYKSNLAQLKTNLNQYREALGLLKEAKAEFTNYNLDGFTQERVHNFMIKKAGILNDIGDTYVYLFNYDQEDNHLDSAALYYRIAYNISVSLEKPNIETEPLYELRNINILIKRKDNKTALFLLNRTDTLFDVVPQHRPNFNYYKSLVLRNLNKTDSSIFYAKLSLDYYLQSNSHKRNLLAVYDNLAYCYKSKNIIDSALVYSNLSIELIRELENQKNFTTSKIHQNELTRITNLNNVLKEKKRKDKFRRVSIQIGLIIIILFLLFSLTKKRKNKAIRKKTLKKEFTDKILLSLKSFESSKDFLDKDFNINVLAKNLGTNTTYLSIIINGSKHKTFKNYITQLRIDYLVDKLQKNNEIRNYTIEAIGNEIGYKNASSFTRAFKKIKGITPSKFISNLDRIKR